MQHKAAQTKTLAALLRRGLPDVPRDRMPPLRSRDHHTGKATHAAGPDYGCVEWFMYEDRIPRRDPR